MALAEEAKKVTQSSEVNELLSRVTEHERAVQQELDHVLSQHEQIAHELHEASNVADDVNEAIADAVATRDSLGASVELAQRVCGPVRSLHAAKENIERALESVSATLQRIGSVEGALHHLHNGEYASAAEKVAEFHSLGDASVDSQQLEKMRSAKAELQRVCYDKLTEASEARDTDALLHYISLLPKLGDTSDAISQLSLFLRSSVAASAKEQYDLLLQGLSSSHNSAERPVFASCLGATLASTIEAIEGCESFVLDTLGTGALMTIVSDIQNEVDSRATQFVRKYQDYHNMQRVSREIAAASEGAEEGPDPRRIERYLHDILGITQKSEEYTKAMLEKISTYAPSISAESTAAGGGVDSPWSVSGASRTAATDGVVAAATEDNEAVQQQQQKQQQAAAAARNAVRTGSFSRAVQELVAHYVGLEEYYMGRSVSKAIKMDSVVGERCISSCVDDAFYVIYSSCMRSSATGSLQSACAMYTNASHLLSNELHHALRKKANGALARISAAFPGVGADDEDQSHARISVNDAFIAVNNLEIASTYTTKLRQDLEARAFAEFTRTNERERIRTCIAELQQVATLFQQACSESVDELGNQAVKQASTPLETLAAMQYELTEEQLSHNETEDPWQAGLSATMTAFAEWVYPAMLQNSYDNLIQVISDTLASRIEAQIFSKRFNQLGGLELDREVRSLASTVASLTSRPVRERFSRLAQLCTVLNAETVQEVLDYWSAESTNSNLAWRLSPKDVKAALMLRSDFHREEIARTKL